LDINPLKENTVLEWPVLTPPPSSARGGMLSDEFVGSRNHASIDISTGNDKRYGVVAVYEGTVFDIRTCLISLQLPENVV
jgi:hypothetical protein